jgi:hypothetical protein
MSEKDYNQQLKPDNALISEGIPEIRRVWYNNEWYYAVVDFIKLWTESPKPNDYWRVMKSRAEPELKKIIETLLVSFPMKATDNRRRQTETAKRTIKKCGEDQTLVSRSRKSTS